MFIRSEVVRVTTRTIRLVGRGIPADDFTIAGMAGGTN